MDDAREALSGRLALAAAFVLVGTLAGCALTGQRADHDTRVAIDRAIERASAAGSSRMIDLGAVTPFEWNKAYLFGAYTSPDGIRQTIGIDWKDADTAAPQASEGNQLIVFVRANSVVGWVEYNDGLVAVDLTRGPRTWSSNNARFRVMPKNATRSGYLVPEVS